LKAEKKIRQLPPFPETEFRRIAEAKNFRLSFTNRPLEVAPGIQTSGEIALDDPSEVTQGMLIKKEDQFLYDTFRDELSLYLHVKGKGLVVLTGCGHCGLINTVKHGQQLSSVKKLYAVIGGLHQNWAPPARIQQTLSILESMNPEIISGMHCTGFRFVSESMRRLPSRTTLAVVGTTFVL
jgi:7,8-dihydropterin-6-yl-methyl-4-(beta-D-ribofuranosyl)aminobenzene 5'-phosphate synthase